MQIPEVFSHKNDYSPRVQQVVGATVVHMDGHYIGAPDNSLMKYMVGQLVRHTGRVVSNLELLCEQEDVRVPERSLVAVFIHDWGQGDVYIHEIDKRHEFRSARDAELLLTHLYGGARCKAILNMVKRHTGLKINKNSPFSHRSFKAADYLDSVTEDGYRRKITKKLASMRQKGVKRPKSSNVVSMMHVQADKKLSRCLRLDVATPYVRDVAANGREWLDGKDGREFIRSLRNKFYGCKRRKGIVYLKR